MEMPLEDVPIKRVRLNGESSLSTPSSLMTAIFLLFSFTMRLKNFVGKIER
jgi:hypothetical protein